MEVFQNLQMSVPRRAAARPFVPGRAGDFSEVFQDVQMPVLRGAITRVHVVRTTTFVKKFYAIEVSSFRRSGDGAFVHRRAKLAEEFPSNRDAPSRPPCALYLRPWGNRFRDSTLSTRYSRAPQRRQPRTNPGQPLSLAKRSVSM